MSKVKFIYIGKIMEHNIPKSGFYAFKLSKRDKEKLYPRWSENKIKETNVLYPQTHSFDGDEVFVRGLGWKKFGKTNKVFVPLFSGEIEDWDNYLKEYGKECLFYSLSGYALDDMDCCASNSQDEFLSIMRCKGGITQYQKYVKNIETIQEIQTKLFNEKLSYMSDYQRKSFIDKNLIRPCFKVFLFITSPYLDTPNDDEKLECFYRTYRHHEIETNHPQYSRMIDLQGLMQDESNNGVFCYTKKYLDYKQELDAIRTTINNCVIDRLAEEMEEGEKNVFPICMRDRLKMLFGEKCNNLYNEILEEFKEH